jgi:beta-galactosidase
MHAALLRPDSVAAPAFDEVAQVARELADIPEVDTEQAPVGLVFDYPSAWAWDTQPQGRDFDYFRLVLHFYRGLRRLGLSIDILPPDCEDLSAYSLVLAPGIMTLTQELKSAFERFEGVALLGPRTNSKTSSFAIPVPLPPGLAGMDCRVERVESLPPDVGVRLALGGSFVHWHERLAGSAEIVERTTEGLPAMMAAGSLRYLGGWPDETALHRMLRTACDECGLEVEILPGDLRRRDTIKHTFYFNYDSRSVVHLGQGVPDCGVLWMKRRLQEGAPKGAKD